VILVHLYINEFGDRLYAPSPFGQKGYEGQHYNCESRITVSIRWDEKAGLRRDAIGSQVIDALEGARDKGDRQ
jgi:hypothetical protein